MNKKKNKKVVEFEKNLNRLLKEQGQLNNDLKEYTLLKKKIMNDIMGKMKDVFEEDDNQAMKGMTKNKKYIDDINFKLEEFQEKVFNIPIELEKCNKELLAYSMQDFYNRMAANKLEIEALDEWIKSTREELKEKIIQKNEIEEDYQKIYAYMHDLVGAEIIEKYDGKYLGGQHDNRDRQ